MSNKQRVIFASLLLSSLLVKAQKDSIRSSQLDEVVVTASKTDQKQSQTGKIVTVLDQELIRRSAGHSLSELLNTQAGFFINGSNGPLGTNLDVYFRGAGTGNMLVVIDGIPVYDPSQPSNSFDLNSIPLEQIEKIEILKGGQSTMWGSDAVAGVIQIFLKKQQTGKLVFNTALSYGSYQTLKATAGAGGSTGKLGYNIQYNYCKSAGISAAYDSTGKGNFDRDGFEQNNLQANLSYAFNPRLMLKAFGNFSTYRNGLDEGAFTDATDYTAKNSNQIEGLSLQFHHHGFVWNLTGSYQRANRTFVDDSIDISSPYSKYSSGHYNGNTATIETFGNIALGAHLRFVGGLQYIHQSTAQDYLNISDYGNTESSIGKDSAFINQESVYGSLLLTEFHGLNVEAGGRLNHHSIYGTNSTYTFNPSLHFSKQSMLFINISSAYKIPSLYQLYSEFGNKALKPESSVTYELGLQTQTQNRGLYLRFALFKRNTKNLIVFYTDTVTYASQYINSDKQDDYGFELESTVMLGKVGTWSNNVAFVDGQGVHDGIKTANLYRRPKFTLNSSLTLHLTKNLTIVPSLKFVGKRLKGTYDIGPEEQPAYYTIDCYLGYDLSKHVRVFVDLHNISNQQYFDIVGYNSKRFNMMAGLHFQL